MSLIKWNSNNAFGSSAAVASVLLTASLCIADSPSFSEAIVAKEEVIRRIKLDQVRRDLLYFPEEAVDCDRIAEEYIEAGDHDRAAKYMLLAAKYRADFIKYKKRERELWEAQPGGITAPAPRPVKR